ncbi:MAG: glutamine synthetase beta-grasp domain-containing protein, partial [Dehalococcoidia bacterium]|nr:glutamine synthetase beta-grasp domain-containing protein [Dehalococcoidia bacterium]
MATNGPGYSLKTPQDILDFVKKQNIEIIDLKFVDVPGQWQHFSIPASELTDSDDPTKGIWVEGIGFDGSSIRGFQKIQESDMLLMPDPATAVVDPICATPTLSLICDVHDPATGKPYSRDPRFIARKAEAYLKSTGIADTSYWGPEMEFFIFDDVRFEQNQHCGYYFIDSAEADWNSGRDEKPNLGYKIRYKEGYFPVPPHDSLNDLRSEIILTMIKTGLRIEVHHHEVATAGQCEIDMRFDTMTRMGDKMLWYKYIVKNIARKHNKVATFMPKPIFEDNGSGMHVHQSLFKKGTNVFF